MTDGAPLHVGLAAGDLGAAVRLLPVDGVALHDVDDPSTHHREAGRPPLDLLVVGPDAPPPERCPPLLALVDGPTCPPPGAATLPVRLLHADPAAAATVLAGAAAAGRRARQHDEAVRTLRHDLRNPLAAALGWASLLDRDHPGSDDEQRAEFVARIVEAVRRMDATLA